MLSDKKKINLSLNKKNSEWYNFLTTQQCVNVTEIFAPKLNKIEIKNEVWNFTKNNLESFRDERNQKEYRSLNNKNITNVGHSVDAENRAWVGLSIRNSSGLSHDLINRGMLTSGDRASYMTSFRNSIKHHYTDIAEDLPLTMSWLNNTVNKYISMTFVKIGVLLPGKEVPLHVDLPSNPDIDSSKIEISSYQMLNTIIYELVYPNFCKTYHGGKIVNVTEGDVFWYNQSYQHGAANLSKELKINIRIHGVYRRAFKQLFINIPNVFQINGLYKNNI